MSQASHQDERPLVSVIMAMRNAAETIGSAVRSIQLQTLQDWELIVIDDGSIDQGAAMVRTFDDPRIRLVCEASGAGLAMRLNQAVALSRGVFIARMDADDVCFPDRLARQIDRLRQEPQLDVLGCGAVVFNRNARLVGELPVGLSHQEITAQPFRGFPFPHPTWCGRAEWFRKHPYDARLMKTQDQDLLLRTFRTSRFAALDEVLMGYRQDALELAKMLLGRRMFIGSLWRYARHSGEFLPVWKGIAMQLVKGGVDVATIGLGLNRLAQQNRLKPVRPAVAKQWQDLQARLGRAGEID
ncbi:Glycosyl transferase family 2 [Bradyrhizobium lablabi]|uniref:Glycosyl transferase family 2 n=1 Tax=Bradyrhizobium lablabi TaxID=722472 RepID=A0A1M7BHT3_9BRAD|nr:glycosyltransferase family A protein [Bradyrhizobium lablabi]SHL54483.1 Glycosyl transferase family 2 [Bradyrhizobium lablabi]